MDTSLMYLTQPLLTNRVSVLGNICPIQDVLFKRQVVSSAIDWITSPKSPDIAWIARLTSNSVTRGYMKWDNIRNTRQVLGLFIIF